MPIAPLPSGLSMSYLPMRPESSLIGADGASGFDSGSLMRGGKAPLGALELDDEHTEESIWRGVSPRTPPAKAHRAGPPLLGLPRLARHREVVAAVAGPAVLGGLLAERDLLAVRHRLETVGGDAKGHQVIEGGLGPPLAQGEVVLDRAALVAVPLDGHAQEVEPLERIRVLVEGRAVGLPDVRAVVVEVDLREEAHALDLVRGHPPDAPVHVRRLGHAARWRRSR